MDTAFDDWFSDNTATFGDRMAAAREALGMTDDELAQRLGVKVKTIRNWEQDVSEPRANKLNTLAGVLNVSLRWLLTGEGEGISAPGDSAVPEEAEQLLTELRQVRADMARGAERLGLIEKRLKTALRGTV